MVPIPAGTFQMGSTAIGGTAAPVHAVTITQPFWCGKYEVTQAEYQAVRGTNPSQFQGASYPNAPQRPLERVTWNDAMAYCAALTATEAAAGRIPAGYQYRLPTEAEWEYVCRAGTTTEWNTGTSLVTSQANFGSGFSGQTTVVGSYAANPWGLFDTHGNVWEWCLDSWDGSANYPSSAVADPYVSGGPLQVFRGGGWGTTADSCRSALRVNSLGPGSGFGLIGFRVVLAPALVP
jgi:formylglycine-generating enzyme required for sulfatase activity